MPRRKENAFNTKRKVQFKILLSRNNRSGGQGLRRAMPGQTVKE